MAIRKQIKAKRINGHSVNMLAGLPSWKAGSVQLILWQPLSEWGTTTKKRSKRFDSLEAAEAAYQRSVEWMKKQQPQPWQLGAKSIWGIEG